MEGTEGSIRSSQVRRTVRRGSSVPNPAMPLAVACACGWYHRRPDTVGRACTGAKPATPMSFKRACATTSRTSTMESAAPQQAGPSTSSPTHAGLSAAPPAVWGVSASDTAAAPCKGQTSATASCGGSGGGGVDSSVRRGDSDRASAQGRSASFCACPPRGRRSQLTHAARMSRPGYRWSQFKKQARQRRLAVCIERHEHAALIARSCVYCGAQPSSTLRISVDRTDSARPYEPQNCVPSCSRCNCMKNTMSLHTFLRQAHRIAQRHPVAGGVHESPVLPNTDARDSRVPRPGEQRHDQTG